MLFKCPNHTQFSQTLAVGKFLAFRMFEVRFLKGANLAGIPARNSPQFRKLQKTTRGWVMIGIVSSSESARRQAVNGAGLSIESCLR